MNRRKPVTFRSWSFEQERDGSWSIFHNGTGYVRGNFATMEAARAYLGSVVS
jgi:hypothetical protein